MSKREQQSAMDRTLFGNYQPGQMVDGKWVPEVKGEYLPPAEACSIDLDLELYRANAGGELPFKKALLGYLTMSLVIPYICVQEAKKTFNRKILKKY